MKILFVIDSMHGGGAARVTSILANELVKYNFDISIATNLAYRDVLYLIDEKIKLFSFYTIEDQGKIGFVKIIRHAYFLRKILKEATPDLIIGEQEGGILYSYLANLFIGIPLIGHRHNTFKIQGLSFINRLIYMMPQKTVLLHNEDVKFVKGKISNILAIYNPHTFPLFEGNSTNRKKQVVCVGSIDRWYNKGFDTMIDIWSRVSHIHKDWKLVIVGGGNDDSITMLRRRAIKTKCIESILFTGPVTNVKEIFQESAIFALPSRVEGFPMVLNEAVSQGCASIAFDLQGVINEIYSKESVCQVPDGDIKKFGELLDYLISNAEIRINLSTNAYRETKKYLPNIIVKDWISLISDVLSNTNRR